MLTAMVISPHADDAAAFCGGTISKLADQGWKVILVRVTDDCRDSVGMTVEETKERNAEELREAARILGVSQIIELGYETDRLADVSLVELREKIVYLFRKHRPYAVLSFDPFGLYEDNMDHVRIAQAVGEAYWVATFDLHHPEHLEEGLQPFSVCERWFFARQLQHPNHAEDVSDYMERKVKAMCAHRTMVKNLIHQHALQLETWGKRVPWLEQSMADDPRPLVASFLQGQANEVAARHGLGEGRMAEEFRRVRFDGLEELFQAMGEPIPGAVQPPPRPGLDAEFAKPKWSGEQLERIFPQDIDRRIRLMGHHHLCVGAFEELFESPLFQAANPELVARLKASPDLMVESIYGYDIFCYLCEYWSEEEGRCVTGWKNKISKDAAVLEHIGLSTGQVTRLGDLQELLARQISPDDLHRFCGPGEWKCEFYATGLCQKGYDELRKRLGITSSEQEH